jgi:hypothetical protein
VTYCAPLPGSNFGYKALLAVDAPIQALIDHVQPAGVLGDVVELQAVQQAPGFGRREGLIKRAGVGLAREAVAGRSHVPRFWFRFFSGPGLFRLAIPASPRHIAVSDLPPRGIVNGP